MTLGISFTSSFRRFDESPQLGRPRDDFLGGPGPALCLSPAMTGHSGGQVLRCDEYEGATFLDLLEKAQLR